MDLTGMRKLFAVYTASYFRKRWAETMIYADFVLT
jgi:hypothetical protein